MIRVLGVHEYRLKTEIDEINTDYGIWANQCSPFRSGGDLPEQDDFVYILFPNAHDPMSCVWLGFVVGKIQNEKHQGILNFYPSVKDNASNVTSEASENEGNNIPTEISEGVGQSK